MEKVTAIFDVGKTNKKFFLFDKNFQEVYRKYQKFPLIQDEDGHPADDLIAIQKWAKELFMDILEARKYDVQAINFSSYGASLVHIDQNGNPITPLYDYSKPVPPEILEAFEKEYGPTEKVAAETGSPADGFLNSAIQLFWIKRTKPKTYQKINYSIHLPQYLSYIFTGIPVSDHTSLGCHTMFWDYKDGDYHHWIKKEGIIDKLAPIVDSDVSINMNYGARRIKVGVGIHDSSAALIPYNRGSKKPFTLVSTGTWSVALRSGDSEVSDGSEQLMYMNPEGEAVSASRFMMGKEFEEETVRLAKHYGKDSAYYKEVNFDIELYNATVSLEERYFKIGDYKTAVSLQRLKTYDLAYHRLILELVECQKMHIARAEGDKSSEIIYVDGGFVDNELFIEMLSRAYPERKVLTSKSALGSALGAAMVISDVEIGKKFLKKKYGVKKHKPLILGEIAK